MTEFIKNSLGIYGVDDLSKQADEQILPALIDKIFEIERRKYQELHLSATDLSEDYRQELKSKIMSFLCPEIAKLREWNFGEIMLQAQQENIKRAKQQEEERYDKKKTMFETQYKYLPLEVETRHRDTKLTDIFSWPKDRLISEPGIYFLINPEIGLAYIGESSNIQRRLSSGHHVYNASDTPLVAQVYPIPDNTQRLSIESELISLFAPPLNRRIPNLHRDTK